MQKTQLKSTTKSFSSHNVSKACFTSFFLSLFLLPPFFLSLLFCLSLSFIIFIISDSNYCHLLLSCLHLAIISISLQHTFYCTFIFHLLFSLSLTLITSIFNRFHYILLLFCLIIAQLGNTFYNKYVTNICCMKLLCIIQISLFLSSYIIV